MLKAVTQNYEDFADVILFFSCLYYFYVPGDVGMVQLVYSFGYELRNRDSIALLLPKTSGSALRATQPPI